MDNTNNNNNNNNVKPKPYSSITNFYRIPSNDNDDKNKNDEYTVYLPFFKQLNLPKPPEEIPFLPSILPEACASKIITGGLMGSIMGLGLGVFMGAMGDVSPIQVLNGREVPVAPFREQLRTAYKSTGVKSIGWAKSFGVLTALFGGIECLIEKYRGKHDVFNPMLSGCAVGATLSAKGGPAAACIGCLGFGGFSLVIDKVMGTH
jgi:import inner membrane translocase subunit TIM22